VQNHVLKLLKIERKKVLFQNKVCLKCRSKKCSFALISLSVGSKFQNCLNLIFEKSCFVFCSEFCANASPCTRFYQALALVLALDFLKQHSPRLILLPFENNIKITFDEFQQIWPPSSFRFRTQQHLSILFILPRWKQFLRKFEAVLEVQEQPLVSLHL